MHIAARCPAEIGLPLVAEMMNAAEETDVISQTVDDERTQRKVQIKGAWRIWNEHSGDNEFIQGKPRRTCC